MTGRMPGFINIDERLQELSEDLPWRIEEVAMSGNKQSRFTDEFKREAVRLTTAGGALSGLRRNLEIDFKPVAVRARARQFARRSA